MTLRSLHLLVILILLFDKYATSSVIDSYRSGDFHHLENLRLDEQEEESDDDSSSESLPSIDVHPGGSFGGQSTFSCPLAKPILHTGDNLSNLSPEDIDIVAAMGDALASGRGLWEATEVEFRGAAFPIGGDANIDGLVTLPNILLSFNHHLEGVSHGMGSRNDLPDYQLNVAESGSETENTPQQAMELVRRLHSTIGVAPLREKWALVTIATGTEEFCNHCDTPDHSSLRRALGILRKGITKALVVLLGPVHVSSSYSQSYNLIKPRCPCLESISKRKYSALARRWKEVFIEVQNEFNHLNYSSFGVLAIPHLTIHSRDPDSLFVEGKSLLNRKGHTYAAKWLWNRLIAGPNYNISQIIFSKDPYYCPSVGCPYFRTVQNFNKCSVETEKDYVERHRTTHAEGETTPVPHRERVRRNLGGIIALVVVLAMLSVGTFGTFFYCRSVSEMKGHQLKHDPESDESAPLPDSKLGG